MPEKPSIKAPAFRAFAADVFGARLNDNICQVSFGLECGSSPENEYVLEEAIVVLTPRSLKVLALALMNGVTQFEAALGQEIQLPPGKMEELEKSFRVARKEQSESKY
jgi:hypothetical protein